METLVDKNGVEVKLHQYVKELHIKYAGYMDNLFVSEIFNDTEPPTILLKEYDGDEGYVVGVDEIEVEVSLKEIAEIEGLEVIETTPELNGYPRSLKTAIIGFKDFPHAQEVAGKYRLQIESFETKSGWGLWTRRNRTMYEPYPISAEIFGDNYSDFTKMSEEDFIEQEVEPFMQDGFESFSQLETFLKDKKEIWDEIELMEEDEVVITYYGNYKETLKQRAMRFYHDTKSYVIGVIN